MKAKCLLKEKHNKPNQKPNRKNHKKTLGEQAFRKEILRPLSTSSRWYRFPLIDVQGDSKWLEVIVGVSCIIPVIEQEKEVGSPTFT